MRSSHNPPRDTRRPTLALATLALVLAFALPAETFANGTREVRRRLTQETRLLRDTLMSRPAVTDAQKNLVDATRAFHDERVRVERSLWTDIDYGAELRRFWTLRREFRDHATWAEPGGEFRTRTAIVLLEIKQRLRQLRATHEQNDPQWLAAREKMLTAREELRDALDEVQYRIDSDQRLQRLRDRLDVSLASVR